MSRYAGVSDASKQSIIHLSTATNAFIITMLSVLLLTGLELVIPYFNGQSHIAYPSLINAFAMTLLYLEIRPASSEGLILFNQQLNGPDFISISLLSGRVVFRYSLGPDSLLNLESSTTLELDQWHSIEVSRTGTSGRLIVDNSFPVSGSSTGNSTSLQLGDDLFLGVSLTCTALH